ncbi:1,4-dihydroxy-2-naphthoate octaprenyltransferase, partial [Psittacicella hinzii]
MPTPSSNSSNKEYIFSPEPSYAKAQKANEKERKARHTYRAHRTEVMAQSNVSQAFYQQHIGPTNTKKREKAQLNRLELAAYSSVNKPQANIDFDMPLMGQRVNQIPRKVKAPKENTVIINDEFIDKALTSHTEKPEKFSAPISQITGLNVEQELTIQAQSGFSAFANQPQNNQTKKAENKNTQNKAGLFSAFANDPANDFVSPFDISFAQAELADDDALANIALATNTFTSQNKSTKSQDSQNQDHTDKTNVSNRVSSTMLGQQKQDQACASAVNNEAKTQEQVADALDATSNADYFAQLEQVQPDDEDFVIPDLVFDDPDDVDFYLKDKHTPIAVSKDSQMLDTSSTKETYVPAFSEQQNLQKFQNLQQENRQQAKGSFKQILQNFSSSEQNLESANLKTVKTDAQAFYQMMLAQQPEKSNSDNANKPVEPTYQTKHTEYIDDSLPINHFIHQGQSISTFDGQSDYTYVTSKNSLTNQTVSVDTLEDSFDDIAELASESNSDILFPNINPAVVQEAYRDERLWRQRYKLSFKRNPLWFIIYHIISPSTLVKPILAVLLGTVITLFTKSDINWSVFSLCLIMAVLLQIFMNLCKEYSSEDLSTKYEVRLCYFELEPNHKILSRRFIFNLIRLVLGAIIITGICLVILAELNLGSTLVFMGIGILTINLLMRYSIGNNPYNFSILGEMSYFLVYGIMIVNACFYLQKHDFDLLVIYPAIAFGLLCVASLNLINMRDSYVARAYHKDNLAVILGTKASRLFQTIFYLMALIFYTYFNVSLDTPWFCYLFFISVPVIAYHLYVIHKDVSTKVLNNQKYITNIINILMTGTF